MSTIAKLIQVATDLDRPGFGILSVVHAFSLAYWPHLYSIWLLLQGVKAKEVKQRITLASPRPGYEAFASAQTPIGRRYAKARATHANAFEQLSLYIGSLVIALYADLPTRTVNLHALVYLLSRAVYTILYLHTNAGPLRTLAWSVGPALEINLLVQSALAKA